MRQSCHARKGDCAARTSSAIAQRRRAFLRAPAAQRVGEARHRRCSGGCARQHRQEAARDLVLALRTGFEDPQAFAQAVVDALVVAGLEMQAGRSLARAPVATVQACRRRAGTARRRSVSPSRSARIRHQLPRHRAREVMEEIQGQGRASCRIREGRADRRRASSARSPSLASSPWTHVGSAMPARAPCARSWRRFLRCLRSTARRGSRRNRASRRRCASGIARRRGPARARRRRRVRLPAWKLTWSDDSPSARACPAIAASKARRSSGLSRQHAWPGDGRVGHRDQPFREVVQAVAGRKPGPGMVEHELAVRVVLQVARCGGDQACRPRTIRRGAASSPRPRAGSRCCSSPDRKACATNGLRPSCSASQSDARMPAIAGKSRSCSHRRTLADQPGSARESGRRINAPCRGTSPHPAPPCSRSRPR